MMYMASSISSSHPTSNGDSSSSTEESSPISDSSSSSTGESSPITCKDYIHIVGAFY